MTGGVDGDHGETQPADPAEQPDVRASVESKAVQEDQRHTASADRYADTAPVIEPQHVVAEPNAPRRVR